MSRSDTHRGQYPSEYKRMQSAQKDFKQIIFNDALEAKKQTAIFLPEDYNFIIFFSLPFVPFARMYRKRFINQGHLSIGLGDHVYQVHDPKRLRSKFLVSKMPITTWLFEDGAWHNWDPSSKYYRHVHLFETAEISHTVVFYCALKHFPRHKQTFHENRFAKIENDFQKGLTGFRQFQNNCSSALNTIFYQEGWLQKGLLDFLPAISFKRLCASWKHKGLEFTAGHIGQRSSSQFRLQKYCLGMRTFNPEKEMTQWLNRIVSPDHRHY